MSKLYVCLQTKEKKSYGEEFDLLYVQLYLDNPLKIAMISNPHDIHNYTRKQNRVQRWQWEPKGRQHFSFADYINNT
jgi:hypothetical protein